MSWFGHWLAAALGKSLASQIISVSRAKSSLVHVKGHHRSGYTIAVTWWAPQGSVAVALVPNRVESIWRDRAERVMSLSV